MEVVASHKVHMNMGLILNGYERELFKSSDLNPLIFFRGGGVGLRTKFIKERWIREMNCSLAFWMLLSAYRNVKTNSDEQNGVFAHELGTALRLTVEGFRTFVVNCKKICHFCITNP